MFTHTWRKYLPVIIILMKKSASGQQVLKMNNSDFMRAAGGRKARLGFASAHLNNGRIQSIKDTTPLAKDLMVLLQENDVSKKIIRTQHFEFTLNNDFQLTIKNNTPPESHDATGDSPEIAEANTSV